jgi:Peptidase family M23
LSSHRTTARGLLFLLLLGVYAGTASAAEVPARTAFPVVGNVTFTNDWHDPRPGGLHEGNDIMSRRHQPAIAFEAGRVDKHVGSSIGTCMLYLHGRSGMTYVYIHLNNDLGTGNDNDGGCRNGVSWAPGLRDGEFVRRGELVGYVGDSGDANGIQPHLHFEIRRPSGQPINPYTYLRDAKRLLYPRPDTTANLALVFHGARIVDVGEDTVEIRTRVIRISPQDWRYPYARNVTLTVPAEAVVERQGAGGTEAATLNETKEGMAARVYTTSFVSSWAPQRGRARELAVERVLILDKS